MLDIPNVFLWKQLFWCSEWSKRKVCTATDQRGSQAKAEQINCEFHAVLHMSEGKIKQSATTADRLRFGAHKNGNIMSNVDPKIGLDGYNRNHSNLGTHILERTSLVVNLRVFKDFTSATSIKSAWGFINAQTEKQAQAQNSHSSWGQIPWVQKIFSNGLL